jgi:transposase
MQAYSLDLRQRIVNALGEGATIDETAQRFAVSSASVKRYQRLSRQAGTLAAKPWPGRAPKIRDDQADDLRALVASRTDWTLAALCRAWEQEHGVRTTVSVLCDTLRRFRITHKKSAASPPSGTRTSAKPSKRR